MSGLRRFLYDNGLSLCFLLLFFAAVGGQAFAGYHDFNAQQVAHQEPQISFPRFVTSSEFGVDVMENWQSEYLQFTLFILLTIWLIQRGSTESKAPGQQGSESDEEQKIGPHAPEDAPRWARVGGARTWLLSNSLLIVMFLIWIGSWFAQFVTGIVQMNADRMSHQQAPLEWFDYLRDPDFWNRTLQNWQSEFLAVGSVAIFTVYLRQRGSAQSKPVGSPHGETAVEG